MAVLLTGGAGFIAATLTARLLEQKETVFAIDNFCRGSRENIARWQNHPCFRFIEADLNDPEAFRSALTRLTVTAMIEEVWHLAANSDIQAGLKDPNVDLKNTFLTTFQTLAVMEEFSIKRFYFTSSSAVYGDRGSQLLSEKTGPLLPISSYGAMKLASEALISAAAQRFLERAMVFRLPNVVGAPATHGIIFDLMKRLRQNSEWLDVLGDGNQRKPYMHVTELVDAMLFLRARTTDHFDLLNLGPSDDGVTVRRIAKEVVSAVAPHAQMRFQNTRSGWAGDVPRFRYSTAKLRALGWNPTLDSFGAVRRAIPEIAAQIVSSETFPELVIDGVRE